MAINVVVAGTGFANSNGVNRAEHIRRYLTKNSRISLDREPWNPHDPNAIGVYIDVPIEISAAGRVQIGHIKAARADKLAALMDTGTSISAKVASFHAPAGRDHPRVSLILDWRPHRSPA